MAAFPTLAQWARQKSSVEIGDKVICLDCKGKGQIPCDCSCPHCEHMDACDECVSGKVVVDNGYDNERLYNFFHDCVAQYIRDVLNSLHKLCQYQGKRFNPINFLAYIEANHASFQYQAVAIKNQLSVDWRLLKKNKGVFLCYFFANSMFWYRRDGVLHCWVEQRSKWVVADNSFDFESLKEASDFAWEPQGNDS